MYSKQLRKSIFEFEQGIKDEVSYMDLLWCELYGSINSDFWSGQLTEKNANYLRQKYLFREEKIEMKLNAVFTRKEPEIIPKECVIEHIEMMNDRQFKHFRKNLLFDYDFIERNIDNMFHDKDDTLHAIAAINEETGDGILIDSSGSSYARYSSYLPKILPYIKEQVWEVVNKVVSEAIFDMRKEFDLEEISDKYGLPLREGNGIVNLFVSQLEEIDDVGELEFYDDGIFDLNLNPDGYPERYNEMEIGGMK